MKQFKCDDVVLGLHMGHAQRGRDKSSSPTSSSHAREAHGMGPGPAGGRGSDPRTSSRTSQVRVARGDAGNAPHSRNVSSASAGGRELEALLGDPRIAVVRAGVAVTPVADQRDEAAALATREHLRR